jgi:hypothetical protein
MNQVEAKPRRLFLRKNHVSWFGPVRFMFVMLIVYYLDEDLAEYPPSTPLFHPASGSGVHAKRPRPPCRFGRKNGRASRRLREDPDGTPRSRKSTERSRSPPGRG